MSTVTVTISAGPHGTVSPEGTVKVATGSDLRISATPDEHYRVADWLCGGLMGIDADVFRLNGVSRDTSVQVRFERILHRLVTTPQQGAEADGGRITPWSSTDDGPLVVVDGSTSTFRAASAPGHVLLRWEVDGRVAQTGGERFTLADIRGDHRLEAVFSPTVTVGPFADTPTVGALSLTGDAELQSVLDGARRTCRVGTRSRFAVADLTGAERRWAAGDHRVPYADNASGAGDVGVPADSIAKLGLLVAAYRLRTQLRLVAAETGVRTRDELARVVETAWGPRVRGAFPRAHPDFPDVAALFEQGQPSRLDFDPVTRRALERMIVHSDNDAACTVLRATGFHYLNGAVRAEGLCAAPGQGIWVRTRFQDLLAWRGAPARTPAQGASLHSLVALLVALWAGEAVDADASREMVDLVSRAGLFCQYAAARAEWGKVGILVKGGTQRYGQVGLYRLPGTVFASLARPPGEVTVVTVALGFSSGRAIDRLFRVLHLGVARRHAP